MDYDVVWDGRRDSPSGPYLFVEPEVSHEERQRPFRPLRDLSVDEVSSILNAARFERHQVIARRFKVSTATVDHLVMAAKSGHLKRQAEC